MSLTYDQLLAFVGVGDDPLLDGVPGDGSRIVHAVCRWKTPWCQDHPTAPEQ